MQNFTFYKSGSISEIKDGDTKVLLVGKVVETRENSFILDDSTGRREIKWGGEVNENNVVKVFCSIEKGELKADIVQNLKNFDLNLFKKIKELYNKVGLNV